MRLTHFATTYTPRWPRLIGGALCFVALFLISCQNNESFEFQPGNCNVHKLLINSRAYDPHSLKGDPNPGTNPYKGLFEKGYAFGCLVTRWRWHPTDPPKDPNQVVISAEDNKPYFTQVKLNADGNMVPVLDSQGSYPIIRTPGKKILDFHLRLYIIPFHLGGNATEFTKLCTKMQRKDYECHADASKDECLFYFKLVPKSPSPKVVVSEMKSCQLCAPEVCDGKDNDCDGKVDNLYSTTQKLTRICFSGDSTQALREGKKPKGICHTGLETCKDGGWDKCQGDQPPKDEACNQKDDDCDGQIDEGKLCGDGSSCQEGKCVIVDCRKDETECGKFCANLQSDPDHCGACNKPCPSGLRCVDGECKTSCPRETPTVCNRRCVDTDNNRDYCGDCDTKCKDGEVCFQGRCTLSCPASAPKCDQTCCPNSCCNNACVDTQTNPQHCGACGTKCPSGNLCFQGKCRVECPSFAPKCGRPGRELCCDRTCCNNACVDTLSDRFNCGSCGVRCKEGEICTNGACVINCSKGSVPCGPAENKVCCPNSCCNNACVDTSNDRNHCGGCAKACQPGEACIGGQCVLDCPTSAPKCGNTCCPNTCCRGVCVETSSNLLHCGGCNVRCPSGQACINGKCGYLCPTVQRLCGNTCVDISVNPNHCGGCNTKCGSGERCERSSCQLCPSSAPTCGQGGQKTCCSLSCCNNACVDTQNNPRHCGSCTTKCASGERCVRGVCQLCPPNAPQCGSSCCSNSCCSNTCVDTSYHPLHCGSCGNVCTNGQTCCNGKCVNLVTDKDNCGTCGKRCVAKRCTQGICCDNNKVSCLGSCVDTSRNNNHCGSCGNSCPTGQTCQNGTCTCPNNRTKCGTVCVDLRNNNQHCGNCGTVCGSGQTCRNSVCTCPNGTTLCAGACVNTQTSNQHCGVCNQACTSGRICQSGQCNCPPGRFFCGNACVDTQTSNQHCGGCGNPCSNGTICCNGGCVNPQTDNNHCGGCQAQCTNGKSCQAGFCLCPPNTTTCGNPPNCVNTQNSDAHCGSCNNACTAPQTCQSGTCQ